MSENAETEKKVTKKPAKKAAKKAATKRPAKKAAAARKPAAKKADAPAKPARKAAKKTAGRGRPAGVRRGKKGAKQFAYLLITPGKEAGEVVTSSINGPFATEANALDDASIMADENTTIVLFRETKRGKVQKSTKFVAGR